MCPPLLLWPLISSLGSILMKAWWDRCITVLFLAEIELISFLVAGVVLCFGFRIRTMLIARQLSSLAQSQDLSWCCPAREGPGGAPAAGRDRPRTDPKGWPTARGVLLCNTTWGAGTAQGQAGHQAAGGGQSRCASPALYIFFPSLLFPFFPIKLSLSQPTSFTC